MDFSLRNIGKRIRSYSCVQLSCSLVVSVGLLPNFTSLAQSVPNICPGACTAGICDGSGVVLSSPVWVANWSTIWRKVGNLWCLYSIDACVRYISKPMCSGAGTVEMAQVLAFAERLCSCVPEHLINSGDGGGICLNPPLAPGQPPTAPPNISNSCGWNCFAGVTGQGPGALAPNSPVLPPHPTGASPIVTTGSDGFWLETPKSIVNNPCWEICEPQYPEPAGTVIIVYRAKIGVNGSPQSDGGMPEHAVTSNGDGTYKSKNGTAPLKNSATSAEAFGEYETVTDGTVTYRVCYRKRPDCQE